MVHKAIVDFFLFIGHDFLAIALIKLHRYGQRNEIVVKIWIHH